MELEEAKEILVNVMADEVIGAYCNEIQKTVDCSKNCENEDCFLQQAIDTVLQELDRLQKENEKLKEIDLTTVHIKGVCDEKERWRNKIREKIEEEEKIVKTYYGGIKYQEGKIAGLKDLLKGE